MAIQIITGTAPVRAHAMLGAHRLWSKATEPTETVADCVQHILRQLLASGISRGAWVEVMPAGRKVTIGHLLRPAA
jgi:hypothetical protein